MLNERKHARHCRQTAQNIKIYLGFIPLKKKLYKPDGRKEEKGEHFLYGLDGRTIELGRFDKNNYVLLDELVTEADSVAKPLASGNDIRV